jgi:hypothetical protein
LIVHSARGTPSDQTCRRKLVSSRKEKDTKKTTDHRDVLRSSPVSPRRRVAPVIYPGDRKLSGQKGGVETDTLLLRDDGG